MDNTEWIWNEESGLSEEGKEKILEFIREFEKDEGGTLDILIEGVGGHFSELINYPKPEDWKFFPTEWICYRKDKEEMAKRVIENLHPEM
ncbi:MAG: hypothetical protein ACP5RW_09190 [bacterium]